ncbi:hypothetical protein K461DRAFT_129807 [Myriangium duriaei CBS 260.36]|uniref:Xylanolytic transcriptional activator regulatory domain-containing protein n=1 Tax=Myriangium duriaei CBS 260.36 TaxID=1168546 RepID=A0A9P4J8X6_9PEZI|nr:hypothetical protein K461DRAFT_129807 [Myriangium duriaei CBS 260.36]
MINTALQWPENDRSTPRSEPRTRHTPVLGGNSDSSANRAIKQARHTAKLQLVNKLKSSLPAWPVVELSVNTYFDRVHWFILVFHQDEVRQKVRLLSSIRSNQIHAQISASFLGVLLTITLIGLQYTGPYRQQLMQESGYHWHEIQDQVLQTLKESFLDIISLGNLEAAQFCVLLGTFYLFHGEPSTAWSICGCATRIAVSLNLHRQTDPLNDNNSDVPSPSHHHSEAGKRCWWAVYEIDTLCCMLYGYTPDTLDPTSDIKQMTAPFSQNARAELRTSSNSTDLLSYKSMMSNLSVIIRDILSQLYGSSRVPRRTNAMITEDDIIQHSIVVQDLVQHLDNWLEELPPYLVLDHSASTGYSGLEEAEKDVGGSGESFNHYILQLQALSLKLAYENARILAHRPLLVRQSDLIPGEVSTDQSRRVSIMQRALAVCRDAALQTVDLAALPIFGHASRTYAAAYIKTHLFTAGVALCLVTCMEPMNSKNFEAKIRLQKLIGLQRDIAASTLTSTNAVEILERLTRMVLEREFAFITGGSGLRSAQESQSDTAMHPAQAPTPFRAPPTNASIPGQSRTPGPFYSSNTTENISSLPNYSTDPITAAFYDTLDCDALQDLENVLSSASGVPTGGLGTPGQDMYSSETAFMDQEQAWIWSIDPQSGFRDSML